MMTGTEIGNALLPLLGLEREKAIITIFNKQGPAPLGFRRISSAAKIDGKMRKLEMDCLCIPFALGTKDDYLVTPAWPWTFQTIADALDCVLPTRKMATLVAQQADFRIFPITISPNSESTDLYIKSNALLQKALTRPDVKGVSYKPGMLVVSPKKDVVIGPNLDGSHVAIYGWFFQPGPQTDTKDGRIQSYSTIHDAMYGPDYSHGGRLFRRKAYLDGIPVSLLDVNSDPKLCVLTSDSGPFPLRFPSAVPAKNTTGKVAANASMAAGAAGGAAIGFLVGGPAGAAVGALLGGAFGRNA